MAIHQTSKIQVRRGLKQDLPSLAAGELGYAIDTQELYIGTGSVFDGAPFEGIVLIASAGGNSGNGSGGGSQIVDNINITTTTPGDFTIVHNLGIVPSSVTIQMTSGGQIWFQTLRYDSTNLYLVASDTGLTCIAQIWA